MSIEGLKILINIMTEAFIYVGALIALVLLFTAIGKLKDWLENKRYNNEKRDGE